MVRFTRLFAAVLVLGVLFVIPAFAEAAQSQATSESTQLVLKLEDPLSTPMDGRQQGVLTVDDLRRIHFLRECESQAEFAQCPGCLGCIVSNNIVYCWGC